MKIIKALLTISFIYFLLTGCSKADNYAAPDSGISGKLMDGKTGNPLEIRAPGGGIIRMLQQDTRYPNPGPIDIPLMADGQFYSSRLFAGTYKVFPRDGAFLYSGDTVTVQLSPGSIASQNFEVDPFYRVTASVTDSTFSYNITAPASNTAKMQEIIFLVGKSPVLNESVSSNTSGYYINLWKNDVSGTPDNTILGMDRTYTINWAATHLPKGTYYFRVGVRTSQAWYNYSPVITATVH